MENIKQFESSLKELEAVVKELEGDMPLDDAIKAFEKGVLLSKECLESLKAEKGRIRLLTDDINKLTEEFSLGD